MCCVSWKLAASGGHEAAHEAIDVDGCSACHDFAGNSFLDEPLRRRLRRVPHVRTPSTRLSTTLAAAVTRQSTPGASCSARLERWRQWPFCRSAGGGADARSCQRE